MLSKWRRVTGLVLALVAIAGLGGATGLAGQAAAPVELPEVQREFRAVWVATVDNIDWPSRRDLSALEQQAELIAIMDRASLLNLNAIVFQVRPAGDALYASELEPWSEYLTGAMGRPPVPFYDPLEFAIEQAHLRGMELHAWFNPYRARHPSARSPVSDDHLSRTRPDLVHRYGRHLWMDPSEPEVRERTTQVILDVVRRYDVDGIHLDDYFYPYVENNAAGRPIPFPDDASWARYVAGGGELSRGDFRRNSVDGLIRGLYGAIKAEKPWVKFGISPFGYWRPGHPAGVGTTFDPYSSIYADARKWILNGWVDYFTPQLYWPISRPDLSYPILLGWWTEQNPFGRHIWPGNFTSRVISAEPRPWRAREIIDQIYVTRGQPGASGNVHFSMKALMVSPDSLVSALLDGPYAAPALIPASPWLSAGEPLPQPVLERTATTAGEVLSAQMPGGEVPHLWVVRTRRGLADWRVEIRPAFSANLLIPLAAELGLPSVIAVSAVDRNGIESEAAVLMPVG